MSPTETVNTAQLYAADHEAIEWRQIPGFIRYAASSEGVIKRIERVGNYLPGPVCFKFRSDGYLDVYITSDAGKSKSMSAHTLVALAFFGPRQEGMQVCHNNGNRKGNRPANLRYGTAQENYADSIAHGTAIRGAAHKNSKLTESDVVEIKKLVSNGELTMKGIGALYGVSGAMVSSIADGRAWKHVGERAGNRLPAGNKKLTWPKVIDIRSRGLSGESMASIAASFGISESNVWNILKGKTWTKCDFQLRNSDMRLGREA